MSAAKELTRIIHQADIAERARRRYLKPRKERRPVPDLASSSVAALVDQMLPMVELIGRVATNHAGIFDYANIVTNAEIVADKAQLKALRAEHLAVELLRRGFAFAEDMLHQYSCDLDERISCAKSVTQITKSGMGLNVLEQDLGRGRRRMEISAVGDHGRSAEVDSGPGKHHCTLTLEGWNLHKRTGVWECTTQGFGDGWLYEEACAEARFWVVGGVTPLQEKWARDLPKKKR